LLVVSTGNLEDVTLELITDILTHDFLRHSLVIESTKLLLIFDFDALLSSGGRITNVKLHLIC